MRAMAAATQSRYPFLTDDSGVGNSHAPPAIDCYPVTRLDALVRRVIDTQVSGRRIEPADHEIIRSGKYDAGKCIHPDDFKWRDGQEKIRLDGIKRSPPPSRVHVEPVTGIVLNAVGNC